MIIAGYSLKRFSKPHKDIYDFKAEKDGKMYYAILGFQMKDGTNYFKINDDIPDGNVELTIVDPTTEEPVDYKCCFLEALGG